MEHTNLLQNTHTSILSVLQQQYLSVTTLSLRIHEQHSQRQKHAESMQSTSVWNILPWLFMALWGNA